MIRRVKILVSGRVQGVGFRHATRQQAQSLGLTGSVKNLPDGRVEIFASGDTETLESLIAWSRKGSKMAGVDNVQVTEWLGDELDELSAGFEIK